ncbi:MAG TPA: Sec-independent protein translocase protein TatB [Acidimicrobiales bacterium]|nr:Sec-independent protein translocase protein TatB [Acidimicrobiales bacterium]
MLNIGAAEMLVVLVVALLVLGPNKLPDAARQVGRAIGEMRRLSNGFQAEMRGALHEPVETKPRQGANATKSPKTGGTLAAPRAPAGDELEVSPPAPTVPDVPEGPAEPGADGAAAT